MLVNHLKLDTTIPPPDSTLTGQKKNNNNNIVCVYNLKYVDSTDKVSLSKISKPTSASVGMPNRQQKKLLGTSADLPGSN